VLLLAFGTVDSLDNIGPFLKNIGRGRPVTDEMAARVRERYRQIGGASPLLDITRAQAGALEKELNAADGEYSVYVGMMYWQPYIKNTIRDMWADGIEEAVAVIMSQHSSRAATGWYVDAVEAARKSTGGVPEVRYPPDWHTHPLVVDAIAEHMEKAFLGLPPAEDVLTIFSAHSLPVASVQGDTYLKKLKETIDELTRRTGGIDSRLAFQSRSVAPVDWLSPDVETVIEEAKAMEKKGVLVVPLGFVSDHVETLYDIDIVFRQKAESLGLAFARAASLNTSKKFIKGLAEVVRKVRF
jgi:ferrochelatase